jgi:hypothetical protein
MRRGAIDATVRIFHVERMMDMYDMVMVGCMQQMCKCMKGISESIDQLMNVANNVTMLS